jgi:predicted GIY-YIG superfamily endonuclease
MDIAELAISARDQEAYTFAQEELRRRPSGRAKEAAAALTSAARLRRMARIAQLEKAYEIVRSFRVQRTGRKHVYVVLLQDGRRLGFYVGQTGIDTAERYAQHKSGKKASRRVFRHGRQPMPIMTAALCGVSSDDANRIERDLAIALRNAKFWIECGN